MFLKIIFLICFLLTILLKVKNLAEINSELVEKISNLEKQIELGQAAYQKQSVLLMRERESRLFYQNCVKESGQNFQVRQLRRSWKSCLTTLDTANGHRDLSLLH